MCGLLGMLATGPTAVADREWARLRDLMEHRGPDGAGLWRSGPVGPGWRTAPGAEAVLAHRRLAVLDPTPAGAQPMATPDGRFVMVYNGELYNEPELRARLAAEGVALGSACDTEVVLAWLARRGAAGLADLRGMFALALVDVTQGRVLLARDPLGVKPLLWWQGRWRGAELVLFASEPRAILEHPAVTPEPDPVGISGYLTTIRTSLGERTLFKGVRMLPPGRAMEVSVAGDRLDVRVWDRAVEPVELPGDRAERVWFVRETVRESVVRHLRSDVPTCCLLSGGLDSAIVTRVASGCGPGLRTYCAGARSDAADDDFAHAGGAAAAFGTRHGEAEVDGAMFADRWLEMTRRLGTPLSTPNEVAIHEVARRLRDDGCVVTLSGEGADELFGGYDRVLGPAGEPRIADSPGRFHLDAGAWVSLEQKRRVLRSRAWVAAGGDEWLTEWAEEEFAGVARGGEPLADHLRFQRRVNLAGLLQRLDGATMLAGVEGRTPFADAVVASVAESLPVAERFVPPDRTKIVLREAFGAELPAAVVARAKASFPLPFQGWMAGCGQWIRGSGLVRSLVRDEVLEAVASEPERLWHLAWPLANLAAWGEVWWAERPALFVGVDAAA